MKLSTREIEVMQSLYDNQGNREKTCMELKIQNSTLKTHLGHVHMKLHASTILEAMIKFLQQYNYVK